MTEAAIDTAALTTALVGGMEREQLESFTPEALIVLLNHTHGGVTIHTYDEERGLPLVCCHPGHTKEREYKGSLKPALIGAYLDAGAAVQRRHEVEATRDHHSHAWTPVRRFPEKTEWACAAPGCTAVKTTYGGAE